MNNLINHAEIWALVLAAGKSRRMGTQKLLLPYRGKTIIEAVIDNILLAGIDKIMVVLGYQKEEITNILQNIPVNFCYNSRFDEGMHTSVICGFSKIPRNAHAALVFLGDQPFIPVDVIRMVVDSWKASGKGIVVPTFKGERGHPTLFDLKFRREILELDPSSGLKSFIKKFAGEVIETETNSPEILRDIDTKNDYFNELNQIY